MKADVIREPVGTLTILPPQIDQREADHRIANSLQLVAALLSVQARETTDPEVRGALAAAVHRLSAIWAVHRQLCQSDHGADVDIASYLFELADGLEPGGVGSLTRRKQIRVHVEPAMVAVPFARVLGILVTELVLNSLKHAYAPGHAGDVDVCLFFPTRGEFLMEVRDYGGPAGAPLPKPEGGLGSLLIGVMSRKLNARYIHARDEEGTRFTIRGSVGPVPR